MWSLSVTTTLPATGQNVRRCQTLQTQFYSVLKSQSTPTNRLRQLLLDSHSTEKLQGTVNLSRSHNQQGGSPGFPLQHGSVLTPFPPRLPGAHTAPAPPTSDSLGAKVTIPLHEVRTVKITWRNHHNLEEQCDHPETEESSSISATMTLIITADPNPAKEVKQMHFPAA